MPHKPNPPLKCLCRLKSFFLKIVHSSYITSVKVERGFRSLRLRLLKPALGPKLFHCLTARNQDRPSEIKTTPSQIETEPPELETAPTEIGTALPDIETQSEGRKQRNFYPLEIENAPPKIKFDQKSDSISSSAVRSYLRNSREL